MLFRMDMGAWNLDRMWEREELSAEEEARIRSQVTLSHSPGKRTLYLVVGHITFAAGMIGLLLPLVPTTPFLLLTAYFYAQASERFYFWLLTNRFWGRDLREFRSKGTLPWKTKAFVVSLFVATFGVTILFIVPAVWGKIVLSLVAAMFIGIVLRIPTG